MGSAKIVIHCLGSIKTPCGLPVMRHVVTGNPVKVTCRNCQRTAVYKFASDAAKRREAVNADQLLLFDPANGEGR